MRLAVKGIGVCGAFGTGVQDLRDALARGESRLGTLTVPTAQGPVEVPAFRACTDRLVEFLPARSLRRIDHYSKLALLGASLALQDGGVPVSDLSRVGIIIATGYGATSTTFAFVDSMIDGGDLCASPTHFANSVHNSAAANISVMLGATGPSLTVSQFEMSVPSALVTARQWLAERRVDAVLVGAVDELSDLTGYLWHRRYGLRHPERIAPLDLESDSCILGEGAAFLLLAPEGQGEGYCAIDSVVCRTTADPIPAPDDALFVLGADGRRESGLRYHELLPPSSNVACYAPIYGSTPAAAGFDLACAALIIAGGRVYPLAGAAGCDLAGNPARPETKRVCVVRVSGSAGAGMIGMSPL